MANPKQTRPFLFYGALLLAGLGFGVWLYGGVIDLPLYHDDAVVLRALDRQSLTDIWVSSPLLPYYRPLSYLPWKLMQTIGGRVDPYGAHLLILGVHVVNVVLVGLLAQTWAQDQKELAGLIAAAWFATFPFNYQVVAWVTALPHVLVTASALGSVLSVLHWRRSGARWALLAMWGWAFLGIFAHENGVLGVALVAIALFIDADRIQFRRSVLPLVPLALMAALFVLGWLAAPKVNEGPSFSLEGAAQNLSYLSQGLSHPFALLGRPLMVLGLNDQWAARLVAGLVLVLLVGVIWRARDRGGAFALLWYVVAISLSTVFLGFDYTVDSPRLMYFPAAGAALAWAFVLRRVRHAVKARKAFGFAVLLAALVSGIGFVQGRMWLYGQMGTFYRDATRQIVKVAERVGGPAVFINAPTWAAYREPVYALGHEGVALLADYMGLRDLVWANTGIEVDIDTVYRGDRVRPASYWIAYHQGDAGATKAVNVAAARALYQSTVIEDRLILWSAWRQDDVEEGEIVATFDNGAALRDMSVLVEEDRLRLITAWHAPERFDETLFLHVVCDGAMVAQADGLLLGSDWPMWHELRDVALPRGIKKDCLKLFVGLYDPASGMRLAARNPEGALFSDGMVQVNGE